MIKVTAKCEVKEGNIAAFKEITAKLVEATNANDDCIVYELFQDIKNENIFMFVEEWDSIEKLDAHAAAPHCVELGPKMQELLVAPLELLVMNLVK